MHGVYCVALTYPEIVVRVVKALPDPADEDVEVVSAPLQDVRDDVFVLLRDRVRDLLLVAGGVAIRVGKELHYVVIEKYK